MLPFGTGKVLTDEQVLQVVSYVLSKQGIEARRTRSRSIRTRDASLRRP